MKVKDAIKMLKKLPPDLTFAVCTFQKNGEIVSFKMCIDKVTYRHAEIGGLVLANMTNARIVDRHRSKPQRRK